MLKTLLRLKNAALDRMEALNALAKRNSRDLTDAEKREYHAKKLLAETLNEETTLMLREIAPSPVSSAPEPLRPNLSERVMAWKIR